MSDALNPYQDINGPHRSPGQHYQEIAGEICTAARLFGLNLSQNALATLVGEFDVWWRTADRAKTVKDLVTVIGPYVTSFLAKKENAHG